MAWIRGFLALILLSLRGNEASPCSNAAAPVFVDVINGEDLLVRIDVALPAAFGKEIPLGGGIPMRLVRAEPADACGPLEALKNDTAVLVDRGSCNFVDKAMQVQLSGGGMAIVVNNATDVFQMGCAVDAGPDSGEEVKIPVVMVGEDGGAKLSEMLEQEEGKRPVMVTVYEPKMPIIDLSALILLFLAVTTIALGAWWSQCDDEAGISLVSMQGVMTVDGEESTENFALLLTEWNAVMFVLVASSVLLLLFLFMSDLFILLLILVFAVAAFQSMLFFTQPGIEFFIPSYRGKKIVLPIAGESPRCSLVGIPLCLAIAVTWVVFRHSSWSWLLQDFMGVSLMVFILRQFRLPNLRVACVLLPLAFLYDIWWVFIQPMIFHDKSVMVSVATAESLTEEIPMLLKVPHILSPLGGYSLLGYGDVILPGLLVVFNMHVDLRLEYWEGKAKTSLSGYYYPSLMGYVVGLALTYLALVFNVGGQNGQPALLYLVPCTLGTTLFLAYIRQDLAKLWTWKVGEVEWQIGGDSHLPTINEDEENALEAPSGR